MMSFLKDCEVLLERGGPEALRSEERKISRELFGICLTEYVNLVQFKKTYIKKAIHNIITFHASGTISTFFNSLSL